MIPFGMLTIYFYAAEDWMPGDPIDLGSNTLLDTETELWEYKWNEADDQVHGPFTSTDMKAWIASGYFEGRALVVRKVTATTSLDPFKGFVPLQKTSLSG